MTSCPSNNLVHSDDILSARIMARNCKDCSVELVSRNENTKFPFQFSLPSIPLHAIQLPNY